jgi:hypothetical protein
MDDADAHGSPMGTIVGHYFQDCAAPKRRRQSHADAVERKIEDYTPPAGRRAIGQANAAAPPHIESLALPLIEARRANNCVNRGRGHGAPRVA